MERTNGLFKKLGLLPALGLALVAFLIFLLLVTSSLSAQVTATIPIATNSCCSVDVNPVSSRVFTSGGASSGQVITMIDGTTNQSLGTIGTGSTARVNRLTNKLYAAAVFSPPQGFLVYDATTGNLITTITAFDCPISAGVDSSINRIWGGAQCGAGNDAVFVVDGNTDTLLNPPGRIGSGGVMGNVVPNPVTHIAYIFPSAVSKKVDPNTFSVSVNPFSGVVTAVNPITNRLYASASGEIQIIDGTTEAILATIPGSGSAAVNPGRMRAYVADQLSHSVLVIDAVSNNQLGSIPIAGSASLGEIAVNTTTGILYLATIDGSGANLLVINDNSPAPAFGPSLNWTQLAPTGGPPPARIGHTAVIDLFNDMIVFGGYPEGAFGAPPLFDDVWVLSGADGSGPASTWTQLMPQGTAPAARAVHSAVYDPATNSMIVFGGNLSVGNCFDETNDVWVLANANGVGGTPAWTQLTPAGAPPSIRDGHTAVYDGASNRMIVFGGRLECSNFNAEIWVLTNANGAGGTPTWIQLSPAAGAAPDARAFQSAVYDPGSNRMIVFGGSTSSSLLNDVWVLANANGLGGTPTWTQLTPNAPLPPTRLGQSATYDPVANTMTIFAGSTSGGIANDVWMLANANGLGGAPAWTQVQPTGGPPVPRSFHSAVFNLSTDRMTAFGGADSASFGLNDTWVLGATANTTPPTTTATQSPAPNAAGWNNSNVTISLSATANSGGSGVKQITFSATGAQPIASTTVAGASASVNITNAGVTTISYFATDNAGNVETAKTLTVQIDETAPTTTAAPSPAANAAGWNNSNVTVSLSATDNPGGSGVKQITFSAAGAQAIASTTISGSSASVNITSEGVTTITYFATDNAGNVEAAKTLTIQVDKTPPAINCGSPDGAWHASDISIACTASDAGSGLDLNSPASFMLATSVPAGTETAAAFTNSRTLCDIAGNCSVAGPVGPNKIDKKPPQITITAPAATTYKVNQAVASSYTCTDGGSGVATCAGPVASGSNFDTASVGAKTFTVNSTDNVGNASTQSVSYSIGYAACLLYDTTHAAKSGSTIPIKFQLCDALGNDLSSASITVTALQVIMVSTNASSTVDDAGNANPDSNFRFDSTLGPTGGYIFNLQTTGLSTGTYVMTFTVSGDPTTHNSELLFQVR